MKDVNWVVTLDGVDTRITGSGTYRVGGEVAVLQQMALTLKVGDEQPQAFDSGLVPGASSFPEIDITAVRRPEPNRATQRGHDGAPVRTGRAARAVVYGRDTPAPVGHDASLACGTTASPVPSSAPGAAGGLEASSAPQFDPVVTIGGHQREPVSSTPAAD